VNARRQLLIAIGAAPFLYVKGTVAQDAAKRPRIGYIGTAPKPGPSFTIFRDELQRIGYIEGKNVVIDYKSETRLDRIPGLVEELIKSKVDVLVATNVVAIRAAQQATTTIPIVMVVSVDPVTAGFAQSLRQPGGNITGISTLRGDLSAKRVELLKELIPGISRVAILWDPDGPGPRLRFQEYSAAAKTLKLDIQSLEVRAPTPDLDGAFQAAREKRAQALIFISNPFLSPHTRVVAGLAAQHGLRMIGEDRRYTEAGGLISYGEDMDEQPRVLASIVARILKGAKPASLPIEQPTRFELVVNLKTAKALNIKIPPEIMVRANRVIQ
jgi:putative ABC transport system substrate-binding protein